MKDENIKAQKLLASTGDRANFDIMYIHAMNIKDYIVLHITLENNVSVPFSHKAHNVLLLIIHEEDYKFVQKFILL